MRIQTCCTQYQPTAVSCSFSESCASNTHSVVQTPPFIIKKIGDSVSSEIRCSHNVPNYDRILWYKQDEHRALHFLGYLNVMFPNPEDNVKGKISFNGDGRKHSNLSISTVSVNDSAVYFCAASQSPTHFVTLVLLEACNQSRAATGLC
uniref:Ig-like domain-containing protein n=1 Tax=Amphiprion ocellaris TaxID=80972 RepID=A0A3Q1BSX4_AMPOC